jgi:hypothetical protein
MARPLDRLIDEVVKRTVTGNFSLATERAAEEFGRELLADKAVRREFHEFVRARCKEFFGALTREEGRDGGRSPRRRRRRRRRAA